LKAIEWSPELRVLESPPPPIPEGWVFGKVIVAMLSTPDKLFSSALPPPLGVVPGSYGALRVLEVGIDSKAKEGKIYGVIPYSKEGFLGVSINGLMSYYASVPSDSLIGLEGIHLDRSKELLPLWLEFSFIPSLKEAIKKSANPLILGCNFLAYVMAANLKGEKEITVGCVSSNRNEFLKYISELGVKVINILKGEYNTFDFVALGTLSSYYSMNLFKLLISDEDVTIYLPPGMISLIFRVPESFRRVTIEKGRFGEPGEGLKALLNIREDLLKKNIAVAKELEEVIHLIKHYPRVVWSPTS